MRTLALAIALLFVLQPHAHAHRASDSFVALTHASHARLTGHWDVALRDLAYALALDGSDGALSWGELRAHERELSALLRAGLHVSDARGACALESDDLRLVQLSDGLYARLSFALRCPAGGPLRLASDLFAQVDRDHRVLLRAGDGDAAETHVLRQDGPTLLLPAPDQGAQAAPLRIAGAQLWRGIAHIFAGADHIAFLLVLLLPAVFRSSAERRRPRALVLEVAQLVSAFTLAHSLTLSLAALGFLRASADVIEPAIALSVALAALRNLLPDLSPEGFVFAFALGLLHGFGFSSALADAGLAGAALLWALLGFNLGVELGQLAIVLGFVPFALLLRRVRPCRDRALPWGSAALLAPRAVLGIRTSADRMNTDET